ncbi:MAG: Nif3-like dinuclear metal center hexameric protein [Bacteroidetes bacterium]|nr:MAG: Nif3-like dinuclear metal center hexameric protein [Bacteroidota bacterium]
MKIKELINPLEKLAPPFLQESYDNAGLLIGNSNAEVNKVLICLDVTEEILDEAISKNCQIIIAHHPLIFTGLKRITGKNMVERIVTKAIKNDIAIYAIHTNLDNVMGGVNSILCEKLGIKNPKILSPKEGLLRKLVIFCPLKEAPKVRQAIFDAGAGHIGNYDSCSFNTEGVGSFKALEGASPFVGEKGKPHFENEVRIESIYPIYKEHEIIQALQKAHPYEEVAYDIYPLMNTYNEVGAGMIGDLQNGLEENVFLQKIKEITGVGCIRHSALLGRKIKKVAVCGGSGSFLIHNAISAGADMFISGDIKYHEFFEADKKTLIADIGHYESEQFSKDLIYSILIKNFPTFAVLISERNTNSVNYF